MSSRVRVLLRAILAGVVISAVAVVMGPAAPAQAAPYGSVLTLDGADDYAGAPDSSSLDLGVAGQDFTIEASVYVPDETSDANQIVFFKQWAYALSVNFNVATADALIFEVWSSPTTFGRLQLLVSHALSTGWHHIAAEYDNQPGATPDGFFIYLDGEQVAANTSAAALDPGIYNASNPLSVGANSGGAPWSGWLDEARFSSSVRYSGLTYVVPAGAFTPDAATRTLWRFNDSPCGTSLADSSGNSITLTAHNGAHTTLPGAAEPSVQFGLNGYSVKESAGTATVTVTRTGNVETVGSVTYATSAGTASAGADYTDTSGPLTFACGQVSKAFAVPISNDVATEASETIGLSLSAPTGGFTLGAPATATLTIGVSDQRPDGQISTAAASGYIGNNVYNTSGAGQTKTLSAHRGEYRDFYVRVYNDGNVTTSVALKGSAAVSGSTVRYYSGTTAITNAMRSSAGLRVTLAAGAYKQIKVRISILASAKVGSGKTATVTGVWNGDGARTDVVKAIVKVGS